MQDRFIVLHSDGILHNPHSIVKVFLVMLLV